MKGWNRKQRYKQINIIGVNVILFITILGCSGNVSCNNTQIDAVNNLLQDTISNYTKSVADIKGVANAEPITLGTRYKSTNEWNDFILPNQEGNIITSKRLGNLLGVRDSLFSDNDGTLLSEEFDIFGTYISAVRFDYPKWLLISIFDSSKEMYTLTGVIQIDEGFVPSLHSTLKDTNYSGSICVGRYPIVSGDSILFEIRNIYGITSEGKIEKLSLDIPIEECPEPFEPEFPQGVNPIYYYYVVGGKKYTQQWQQ